MLALVLLALISLGGCTTLTESFPGRSREQVWTAMIAVAQTPDYTDENPEARWFVKENRLWVDEEGARLEIYRELSRVLHRAGTHPVRENRTWRFQVLLLNEDPPAVEFKSRGMGIPVLAADEGERFFDDVYAVLEGREREPATEPDRISTSPDDAAQPSWKNQMP